MNGHPWYKKFLRRWFGWYGRGYRIEAMIGHGMGLLHTIARKMEMILMVGVETQKVLDALNTATNEVATKIQTLIDGADLSPEEKTAFEAIVTRLQGLAANPENPVPSA